MERITDMKRVIRARKIGEKFKIGELEYIVAEAVDELKPCKECAFNRDDDCAVNIEIAGLCYKGMRFDDKQICFKRTGVCV